MSEIQLVVVSDTHVEVLEVTGQGPRGIPGIPGAKGEPGSSGGAGVFIFDIIASGVVSGKLFAVEPNLLSQCSTDSNVVRVVFSTEGIGEVYKPTVTANGVQAVLTETDTKRWFSGYADVPVSIGDNLITVESSTGAHAHLTVTRVGGGPSVLGVSFGAYPQSQTSLKAGDLVPVQINTEQSATLVEVLSGGACEPCTLPVVAGVASTLLVVSSLQGAQGIQVRAKNDFGTAGAQVGSTPLYLDQTKPVLSSPAVYYPSGKQALNLGDTAQVYCQVSDFTSIEYSTSLQSIAQPYQLTKDVVNENQSGYQVSGTNYTVTAHKASNGSSASAQALVRVATIPPAAQISIVGNPQRLPSSPAGVDYEVRIASNQLLSGQPSLNASVGTWQGSWVSAGGYWYRQLRVADTDIKGAATFSGLQISGPSGLVGTSITSGASYVVEGISSRTLTFAPFSRVVAIGTVVSDREKTTASIVGGNVLTRFDDNLNHSNGYFLSDAQGNLVVLGATHVGLSDQSLAGANTSGTLQITFQELA